MILRYFLYAAILLFSVENLSGQTYTARQLYKERADNSQAFDNKYFNKTLTVKGKIWRISPTTTALPGFKNYHQIALTGTGYESFIVCQLPFEQKETLDQFKTGQEITVTGTYNEKLLDYVVLNGCSFNEAAETAVKKVVAPAKIPFGNYNVYQTGGAGFSFQYRFILRSYTSYTMNSKVGGVAYDNKTGVLRFTSGPLKGFVGVYRPVNPTNENDPPAIVLDAKGKIPDLDRVNAGYLYAYFKR